MKRSQNNNLNLTKRNLKIIHLKNQIKDEKLIHFMQFQISRCYSTNNKRNFGNLKNQRKFMDDLFQKLNLNTLDDWKEIYSRSLFMQHGAYSLISYHYKNDFKIFFQKIYPNFAWDFDINFGINKKERRDFKTIEKQRKFMEELFIKLKLNSLDDWKKITKSKMILNNGKKLLLIYENNWEKLLTAIYPFYNFNFEKNNLNEENFFLISLENQKKFMDELFIKLNLNSMEDWKKISRSKIIQNGGKKIIFLYFNNMKKLLTTIYPNYNWKFNDENNENNYKKKSIEFLKVSIENQKNLMDEIYKKIGLKSVDDWLKISKTKFKLNGGENLLEIYANNYENLLKKIYPNENLNFQNLKINRNKFFQSIENQKKFMENLFIKLKLNSLDDWLNISRNLIIKNGGKSLILYYYLNDMKKLLKTIYPNHQWKFDKLNEKMNKRIKISEKFVNIEIQRKFLDNLFIILKLNSLDDWKNISKKQFCSNGGQHLLSFYYSNDMKKLLTTIYPTHSWQFNNNINNNLYINNILDNINNSNINNDINNNNINNNLNNNIINDNLINYSKEFFQSIENQKNFMDNLFIKLKLTSLDDWLEISRNLIKKNGGKNLISHFYLNDMKKLLKTIYPNHQWKFDHLKFRKSIDYFQSSLEIQKKYLDYLFIKLEMKNLNDWLIGSKTKLSQNGAKNLLFLYSNNVEKLFSTIYPNHPWPFLLNNNNNNNDYNDKNNDKNNYYNNYNNYNDNNLNINILNNDINNNDDNINNNNNNNNINKINKNENLIDSKNELINDEKILKKKKLRDKFKTIENQRKFMENLFYKFKLKSLNDFLDISKKKIKENGGNSLISYYYFNDMKKLLLAIFPNYPWEFLVNNSLKKLKIFNTSENFSNIENQKKFMERIFLQLKLKSLDDWMNVKRKKIIQLGGKRLISKYYLNDMKKLLITIYPNHDWKFDRFLNVKSIDYFYSIDNQKEFMEELFKELKLKSVEEFWFVSRKKMIKNGGKKLLSIYSNDMKKLLSTIYPSHHWNFNSLENYFFSIENQRKFLDNLFIKFNLLSLNDWLTISKRKFIFQNGAENLLSIYANNMKKMLFSVYPTHNWPLKKNNSIFLLQNQLQIVENIFFRLHFKTLDDWLGVSRSQLLQNGAKNLLKFYSFDLKKLLLTLYPNFLWEFEDKNLKFRPTTNYFHSFEFIYSKLKILKRRFKIEEKKDWLRLPIKIEEINLFSALKLIYPNEIWDKKEFQTRSKLTRQRILFISLQQIYSQFLIIENYRPPLLTDEENFLPLEYDLFIPALNMAFEYQGEQHYDDIISGFSMLEVYQSRDKRKDLISSQHSINLIIVPFWWDQSIPSLLSTINLQK